MKVTLTDAVCVRGSEARLGGSGAGDCRGTCRSPATSGTSNPTNTGPQQPSAPFLQPCNRWSCGWSWPLADLSIQPGGSGTTLTLKVFLQLSLLLIPPDCTSLLAPPPGAWGKEGIKRYLGSFNLHPVLFPVHEILPSRVGA